MAQSLLPILLLVAVGFVASVDAARCNQDILKNLPRAAFGNINSSNGKNAKLILQRRKWKGVGYTDGVVINLGKVYEIRTINILRGVNKNRPRFLTLKYSMDGRNFLTKRLRGSSNRSKKNAFTGMNPPIVASVIKVMAKRFRMRSRAAITFQLRVRGCIATIPTEAPTTPLPARTTPARTQAPTTPRAVRTTQERSRTTRSSRGNCSNRRNSKRPAGIVVAFDSSGSQASSLGQQGEFTEALYTLLTTKNVFCKRKMKISVMTIGEGQSNALQFQTKNFNNNRAFKRSAKDKKDNFVQQQMASSPTGLTDLGDAIKRATNSTSFPQNAKKYLFLVSDFIITKNSDTFSDAVAEAKSLDWNVIPVLMKSEVKNTFGESNFNKAGGSEKGINLQNDPISSQSIKQVLTSNGF